VRRRADLFLALAPLGLLVVAAAGVLLGPEQLSPRELFGASGRNILETRVPRVLLAAAVGAALSVAGVLFQAILRNPLADPYVLGASSGAGLGAALAILAVLGTWLVAGAAFAGAMAATYLVYRLAMVGGRLPRMTLLLCGVVVGYLLGGFLLFLVSQAGGQLNDVMYWLMGSLQAGEPRLVTIVWVGMTLGTAGAWLLARDLDLLALGEEQAEHLGLAPERAKTVFFALGSLLTGAAVAASGMIGFVGLVVPHLVRMIIGPGHRRLAPCAAFAGAAFLVLVELVSRSALRGREIPVGVVTAFVGGPFFLWLLRHQRKVFWG
jgi:iron complex transport system permease protein